MKESRLWSKGAGFRFHFKATCKRLSETYGMFDLLRSMQKILWPEATRSWWSDQLTRFCTEHIGQPPFALFIFTVLHAFGGVTEVEHGIFWWVSLGNLSAKRQKSQQVFESHPGGKPLTWSCLLQSAPCVLVLFFLVKEEGLPFCVPTPTLEWRPVLAPPAFSLLFAHWAFCCPD